MNVDTRIRFQVTYNIQSINVATLFDIMNVLCTQCDDTRGVEESTSLQPSRISALTTATSQQTAGTVCQQGQSSHTPSQSSTVVYDNQENEVLVYEYPCDARLKTEAERCLADLDIPIRSV
jgi:hypothetical protein